MRRIAYISIIAKASLLLTSCSDPSGFGEPITELPRALTVIEQEVISQANVFGLELLRETVARDDRPNIVLSPLSASMALGMTLNGAADGTFDAMRSALGFEGLTQEEINGAFRDLIELLTTLDPAVRFDIANSIWANENVQFHDAFLQAVSDAFGAATESRDFTDPATLAAINAWVEDNTNGFIDRILDSLDPALVMLLINAIYFDGAWTNQFDPADTNSGPFTREDGFTVEVDMMSMSDAEFPRSFGPGYSAIELPYGGGAFSMVLVLPQANPRDFVSGLDGALWDWTVSELSESSLDLRRVPKFTLSYDAYLNEPLKAMGMDVAFTPAADFTAMSPVGDQFCIDFVRQKTFIEVDERGTKAAAVTAVGVGVTSFNGLILDRPFVFAIRERFSGTILFTGLVGDPTAEDPGPEPFARECL
jgi:serpin B